MIVKIIMEPVENINNAKVKRFIESQIRPGESYNYEAIQERFNKVLAREENKELRNFRLILEGINKGYKSLIEDKTFQVSGWYVNKLREFIFKYRQRSTSEVKSNVLVNSKVECPPKVALFATPDVDRGTYWQEANTDEFGCVVVCDDKD